ncbi:DUF2357 domain-containing protein [Thermococcus sp. EP1]|uniref:DUF2357 domain-containing protein n=1 Tax=Thermococcus sp. EP1 TaxID=1591054 RepID=UPI0006DC6C1A|nr:DUF2357 domain-containing protein [Thermococcus sp. EP1]
MCIEKGSEDERKLDLPFRIGSIGSNYWAFLRTNENQEHEIILFEWKKYEIEASEAKVTIPDLEDIKESKIHENTFTFTFKNYIGRSKLIIEDSNRKKQEFPIIVLSEKFGKITIETREVIDLKKITDIKGRKEAIGKLIERFNKLTQKLTDDITRISSSLNFSIRSPTAFTVYESDQPMNELFAYHYLRSNKERIIEAFETVIRRIKRNLIINEELLEFYEVDDISPETLVSLTQHPEYIIPTGEDIPVAKYLDGYVPTKVFGFRKYESFDTPENRFVKHFLKLLIEWAEKVINTFKGKVTVEPISEVLGELEFIMSDGIWDEIGEMTLFPYTSQTLLKGDGYKELLELYREFTSYVPFFDDLQRVIDNKDIAKLYEYWTFFRLVEELGKIFGKKELKITIEPTGELLEKEGKVYAKFDNGWRLYYNKRLTLRKWSYSVTLRPDFSLFNDDPSKKSTKLIGVFDAKFKLDIVDTEQERKDFDIESEEAEKSENHTARAKTGDIYKMHTYRDALGCRFAVVVYPGEGSIFFDVKNGKITKPSLDEILIGYVEGVGYLSFKPERR